MEKIKRWALPALAFVLPLALYIKTLAPTYIPIDSAELALCAHFWGICHPPGFPLYVLAGKIFTSIFPFGSLIYKANLLSSIFGASTILVVYFVLGELKVERKIALFLSLMLAVSSVFWEFSLAADVFTPATFLIALTFLLAFKNKPFWAFFVLGLSASHFYISAILAPVIYWYFWPPAQRAFPSLEALQAGGSGPGGGFKIRFREALSAGFLFILGFFPQILMFWRMQQNPAINWGHAEGIAGFVDFVRRKEFGSIFLLANPVLKFSLIKVFKHFHLYFASLLVNFGVVLPILILVALVFGRLLRDRRAILILLSFLAIVMVQLSLLSTIDPTGEDNPFQINKFYLTSFVLAIFLVGKSLQSLTERIFGNEIVVPLLLVSVLVVILFLANFKTNDYANNYFSQNLVVDALEQLPPNSVAITVSHITFFGGLYEQKINGKYQDIKLLYFPNENNRDIEGYHSELFGNKADSQFMETVQKGKAIGGAERYVLETISRNLDKPIFVQQGTFEEGFFNYLKPYIRPYGLWWKLETDLSAKDDPAGLIGLLAGFRNANVKFDDLELKQQKLDSLNYAVAYHSTAIALAGEGKYDQAIAYLQRSYQVRPKGDNIQKEIELVGKTKQLVSEQSKLVQEQDELKLTELGNNLFTLGNFKDCVEIFSQLVKIDPQDARNFNNLASCLASLGKKQEARENYQKALGLDPNLDLAKKGLEVLEE